MEIGISEMIDRVEDFIDGGWKTDMNMTIGCIAGTSTFKNVLNACLKSVNFDRILIIDGCRDYIGLLRKPIPNYLFYQDLFRSTPLPDMIELMDPMRVRYIYPRQGYQLNLIQRIFSGFNVMIINNAQLIPNEYMDMIKANFPGKLVMIVDPFEINTEHFSHVHYVTDSLTKQSSNIAYARSLYKVETRATDKKVRCSFEKIKMARRSIGKLDEKQYVTNSPAILEAIREKQYRSAFRRHMRFISKQPNILFEQDEAYMPLLIGPQTMFSVTSVTKLLLKLRIHSSKAQFWSSITYDQTSSGLLVEPANIISLDQAVHHRFNNVVMVLGEEPMTTRQWYTLLKIGNNISVVDFF